MTLLTTVFAAVFCTVLWYQKASARELKVGILCWMFWGASLMWLGDAIFEYAELGAAYFTPAASDMLVIWLVIVLIKDPKGVVRAQLFKKA